MKVFLLLVLAAVASAAVDKKHDYVRNEFNLYKKNFNKVYADAMEDAKRFQIFSENLKMIQEHNLSGKSWQMGINQFTDMTSAEFASTLGYTNTPKHSGRIDPASAPMGRADGQPRAESINWADLGATSPVKDQGGCGSCWAFTATEMIESYAFLSNGTMEILSPQQINSCTPNELGCGGDGGCAGSIPQLAFTYAQLYGVTTDANYPYVSGNTGVTGDCTYDASNPTAYVRGWELLPRNNYQAVMDHLENVGPLSVAVDASNWGFYTSGIFEGCSYESNIAINHAVQLVGFGTDAELGDYWTIRNSWGESFGEGGFIRLRREEEILCGEDSTPQWGTGCDDDYWEMSGEPQQVCGQCAVLFDVTYPIGAYLV